MDLYRVIRELMQERDRLDRLIESLESAGLSGKATAGITKGKRRGRKSMDPAARAEVSERMKRYWALRKEPAGPQYTGNGTGLEANAAGGSTPPA